MESLLLILITIFVIAVFGLLFFAITTKNEFETTIIDYSENKNLLISINSLMELNDELRKEIKELNKKLKEYEGP